MDHGKMMQAASPFEIYAHPQNTFVADFIGRVDFLRGAVVSMKGEREAVVECGKLRSRFVCTAERPYAVGDEVVIALRPESLSNARGERENEIQGKVRKFVFLGSVMEIEFELDDGSSFDATIYDPIEQKIPVIGERRSLFFSRASAWAIRP
jgi:ABC-type Fe3+/spermidine/putrescine transport system ATPase subunit